MVLSLLARYLLGDDIFVSYSRADGGRYTAALANELTKRKFACRIDTYDTEPGAEIPKSLRKALNRSFVLVVVGTPGAAQSENVTQEIAGFRALRRNIVVLSFGGSHLQAKWYPLVQGLYVQPETADALSSGTPSTESLDLIEDSFRFRRRNQRLAITFWVVAAGVAALSIAGAYAGCNLRTTQGELDARTTTLGDVDRQLKSSRDDLEKGKLDLQEVKTDLTRSQTELEAQQRLAAQQGEIALARRTAADLQNRRSAVSYTSPRDVLAAVRAADTLAAQGLEAEGYALLSEHVAELPKLDVSFRHEGGVSDYMMTPDGHHFVTAGRDGTIRFWDYTNGQEAGPPLRTGTVLGMVFSQDGGYAVTHTTGFSVELWDLTSRTRLRDLSCRLVGQIAISSRGNLVAVECGGAIVIYDRAGKQAFPTIRPQTTQSQSTFPTAAELRFTPDERHIVVVTPRSTASSIAVYELGQMNTNVANENCAQASGGRSNFRLSADGGYVVREIRPREAEAAIAGTSVLLCRLPTLDVVGEFPHASSVQFDLTKDGSFLATLERGTLRIWDTRDGSLRFSHRAVGAGTSPSGVMFSGDGRYVATGDLRVFGVPNGEVAGVMSGPADGQFLAIAGDGARLLAGSTRTGTVHVWSFQTIHRTAGLHFPRLGDVRVSLSPQGRLMAASSAYRNERTLAVWDLSSGRMLLNRSLAPGQLRTAFLSDTEVAVLQSPPADGFDVEIVGLSAGKPSARLQSGFRLVDLGFLEPYGLVGLDSGGEVNRLVEIRSRRTIETWPRDADDECEFVQGPELVLCFGTTSGFRLVGARVGNVPISIELKALAVTPDRQILAATFDRQGFRVYDGRTNQTILRRDGPTSNVMFGDDARFVVASGDGVVRIWNIASGAEIVQMKIPSDANPVAATPRYLAIRSPEQLQLWLWPFAALKSATCNLLARNRSLPAWADLIAEDQYVAACPGGQ